MEVEKVDTLLLPFALTSDEAESERLLSRLIEDYAEPVISRIVGYKTRSARRASNSSGEMHMESEDIRGEVMLQLIQRLRGLRADRTRNPIGDFNAYVAVTTYNAYDRYISRKYPQRRRLKNGLRYLLTHRAGLALWQTEEKSWVGGLSEWQKNTGVSDAGRNETATANRLQHLRNDSRAFTRGTQEHKNWHDPRHAYELLNAIFAWTGIPIELDLLTSVVADWWNVTDEAVEIDADSEPDTNAPSVSIQLADGRPPVSLEVERRIYLKRLWDEITELPPRQRAALLLNLRDEGGRGIVDLWLIVGIATPESMAKVLEMKKGKFAEIWTELPLDDNRIAALLGITRQQVINLRKSARERLARRVKAF